MIGSRLRHARLVNGMRLKDLAERAGCSESLVSKIENDRAVPSLTTLHRLCQSLNTTVSALLAREPMRPWTIARGADRPSIAHTEAGTGEGVNAEILVPQVEGLLLQGFLVIIEPGGHSGGDLQHIGEEAGYVVEGQLELVIDGHRHVLEAGDSFHFPSDLPHAYRNPGRATLKVVWINTPPSF